MQQDDPMLPSAEASKYLGYHRTALQRARSLNVLSGVEPPKGQRRGLFWFYRRSVLDEWMAQFD